jgi:hypothetical protein
VSTVDPRYLRIRVGAIELRAELNRSPTAERLYDALPIRASAQRWGDEIYFEIPVDVEAAPDARDVLEIGELAYWPPGDAFCIFFGPTPASSSHEPRAASPVNPLGRIVGDATVLTSSVSGAEVVLEKA